MIKTALVVEGGAMRSIYAAGVLDTLLEEGFDPFDAYFGVSAGALNLSSFVAGQVRRNYRIITGLAARPEFISLGRLFRGGNVMDLDWLWEAMLEHEPLDVEAAVAKTVDRPLTLCCTRISDGEPIYVEPDLETWLDIAKGTCAIPLFYREPVFIRDEQVMDGALSDAIPVREAYRRGARRIVVVRTHPAEFRKRAVLERVIVGTSMRKHEGIRVCLDNLATGYNETLDFIENPPEDCEVIQVAPSRPLRTRRTTRNPFNLETDYQLGRLNACEFLAHHGWRLAPEVAPAHWQQALDGARLATGPEV